MLKDITLGQYFPGNTPVHRMDPRVKLVLVVLYIVALFLARGLPTYLTMLVLLCLGAGLARIRPRAMLRGLKPVVFILVFTSLINMLYTPGDPLATFWMFTVTRQGLRSALFMVWRIMMLISCTFLLTYTTSPIQLTDALERLLNPLKKLRVPVHELAMMMSIALRFIPTLIQETDKIMSAQRSRGADFDSGNLFRRARALIPLLVPLFISAFRRADELATAMECRCYHGGEGRTRMKVLRCRPSDVAALCAGIALCIGVGVLGHWGY